MKAELPANSEEAYQFGKDYRHTKEELTKAILTAKLKNIKSKFRKAVDSGRKSGHGRVVFLYFELCEKIWGGSPATTEISGGIESTELTQGIEPANVTDESLNDPSDDGNERDESTSSSTDGTERSVIQRRRAQLDEMMQTHKQAKMAKKMPQDAQALAIATEELDLKRQMLRQIEQMDKQHMSEMSKLTSTMDKISDSIAAFSNILGSMVSQPFQPRPHAPINPPIFPQQPYAPPTDHPGPYSFGPGSQ